jgi:hypothetical protein
VTGRDERTTLVDAYRRERLSFLQYVRQANPFAGVQDRPLLERVQELANAEAAELDGLAEHLDRNRVTPPVGAFPTPFTNYNFIAVRKLIPWLRDAQAQGLADLERDVASLPRGEDRSWLEKLAESKRLHLTELEKMAA